MSRFVRVVKGVLLACIALAVVPLEAADAAPARVKKDRGGRPNDRYIESVIEELLIQPPRPAQPSAAP